MKFKEMEQKPKKAEALRFYKGVSPVKQKRKVPLGGLLFGAGAGSFPNFIYHGGPVIHNPLVYNIFLGDWSSTANQNRATRLNQFITDLMNSNYMNMLAQYGCGSSGTLVNSIFVANSNNTLLDSDFHTFIQNEINSSALPEPTTNSSIAYIVFLDDSTGVNDPSLATMCEATSDDAFGYHFHFTTTAGNEAFYAVVPGLTDTCLKNSCPDDSSCSLHLAQTREQRQTQVLSHEFAEMITNPDVLGNEAWSRPGNPHENGDICNGQSGTITVGANTWTVQLMYSKYDDQQSNGATTCVVGSPYPLHSLLPACTVMLDRSKFGKDEIDALLSQGNPANQEAAFYVAVDGFNASQLGITSASFTGVPDVVPAFSFAPNAIQFSASATRLSAPDQSSADVIQRFTWTCRISFNGDADFPTTPGLVNTFTMSAAVNGVSGSADILLVDEPNPYELDGPTSWLSTDLRVFKINQGDSKFGEVIGATPADAPVFIQNVINRLNTGNTAGQTFDNDLPLDEEVSALELSQSVNGVNVFNFAIAKVRFRSLIADATNVRVFFRLFPASTTSTVYDPTTTYRRGGQGGVTIPKLGVIAGETTTIPCFAAPRIDSSSQTMDTQTDAANVQVISHNGSGNEVEAYFGCWLDINQPGQLQFPINPAPVDGPYTSGRLPIQNLIRNAHQCLVAEIAMDGVNLVNAGDTPGSSDKLAQRNLSIIVSDNPGSPASHRIPNTFEFKAAQVNAKIADIPDELLIDWGNVPADSEAFIYLPATNASAIIELANQMYIRHHLEAADEHTLKCPANGITYVPIPDGHSVNYAGLLTIDLPPTVRKGQQFKAVVRQLTNAAGRRVFPPPPIGSGNAGVGKPAAENQDLVKWRQVVGSFQLNIPVKTKEVMLEPEERLLSVLKWINKSIPVANRWSPVFNRYVQQIADRVEALGGDPAHIYPSPNGDYHHKQGETGEQRVHFTGKIDGIIYNHYGDFEGFYLDTEDGRKHFKSHERDMEVIIRQAWSQRILISVEVERDEMHEPSRVVLLSTPKPFQNWS